MQLIFQLIQMLLSFSLLQAAILPLTLNKDNEATRNLLSDLDKMNYLELKPNGSLILRRKPNQNGSNLENLLLLRGVLQALKLPSIDGVVDIEATKQNIKMYGDGVEHKFPPLVENIIQRIQTYFSIYRYKDTSRPIRKDEIILQPLAQPQGQEIPEEVITTTDTTTTTTVKAEDVTLDDKDAYITVGESGE
ncbi:uncharacterized protein Dwil_GK19273 [Drosophila willistoni]|uniref:Uncharacterized protein n=1 Tax=Drosophila willistoni TaxID=7260 RepID=B4MKL2_DROWI|nr:uncharacterized protein LOC6639308 [Drosophila willistoni]EDW72718.1 uncharacterized protein Dwil_GK19273 [Drosophila willistoni]